MCEIEYCIARGMTTHEAARALHVRRRGLNKQCRRLGIHWPNHRPDRRRCVWAYGRWWNFAEIAREIGASRFVIRRRWQRGDRGGRLFRPVRGYGAEWELGLSMADWQEIITAARQRGPFAAANLFNVPCGAINAALRGEWERLG